MRDALASICIINVNHRFSARIKDLFPARWQLEERSGKQSVHCACTYAVRFTGIADSTFWRAVKRVRQWLMLLLHRQSRLGLRWVKVMAFFGGGLLFYWQYHLQVRNAWTKVLDWVTQRYQCFTQVCSAAFTRQCWIRLYSTKIQRGEGRFLQLIRDFQEFLLSSFLD